MQCKAAECLKVHSMAVLKEHVSGLRRLKKALGGQKMHSRPLTAFFRGIAGGWLEDRGFDEGDIPD